MRKANKIMMMTVSILLCLVLITSSVMSSTLAKYVTTGTAQSSTARVAKWGVNVDIKVDETALSKVSSKATIDKSGTNATIEIKNLNIGPADKNTYHLQEMIKLTFSGAAEVSLNVKVAVGFWYGVPGNSGYSAILVDKGVGGLTENTYCMPIGFTFGGLKYDEDTETYTSVIATDYVAKPWRSCAASGSYTSTTNPTVGMDATERLIVKGVADTKIDVGYKYSSAQEGSYISKPFAPNQEILFYSTTDTEQSNPMDTLAFGLEWPFEYNVGDFTTAELDEIGTWLARNKNSMPMTLRFTISIEQTN